MIKIILFILVWLVMYVIVMIFVLHFFSVVLFWLIETEPDKKFKEWLTNKKQR